MPEFPEVHTISQDLKKNIVGFKVKNIQISKYYKIPSSVQVGLKELIGKEIQDVDNIAKNIVLKLGENSYLVFHLAMTGRILLREPPDETDNWVKIVLELQKDNKIKHLKFCDMRQFGKVAVLSKNNLDILTSKYGLMPLNETVSMENFLKAIKSKKTTIKNVLLDQKIISGLGNIYATDALFLANINPKTSTQDITPESAKKLLKSIREILNEGIKNRGSTLPDKMYVDIFGNSGSQQDHFRIYLKNICDVCNGKVEFIKINGRGTYFCPTCQPLKTL
ncbi:bifunctional DNA-formamidopyrimidine glycosylase/DNA-(apurinic or apyrimidinic site) lyase [Patescibacteria group bacterium]|nr:bifunctional DNA-formamidopyrimidine glycosylase/DNA-(apurinic or apyrimidinic site) lyase [Patescibacteria group bacterium]MBU1952710.1 bifunctional DNA-formamidopyrimidine glycosylase/DNA-(apurinic or apyrimidinic site) lyase [Patescibacteria group bacterium]